MLLGNAAEASQISDLIIFYIDLQQHTNTVNTGRRVVCPANFNSDQMRYLFICLVVLTWKAKVGTEATD